MPSADPITAPCGSGSGNVAVGLSLEAAEQQFRADECGNAGELTERTWELPAAGATLRERWEAIAPELVGHVFAVGYDPDSGQLTVCPESSAWATKTRLVQARIIAAANASAGRTVVRGLRIPAPGSVPAPAPDDFQAPEAAKGFEDTGVGQRRLPPCPRHPPRGSPAHLADPDIA
ncbi:DUF721 domain-containing protein [Streptomyces sp. NPDC005811]|uniref:DUF721 domain-containing protein n=1 Tax=Streptomyces sp. NPDC005811 TaxID=3154565 RepID=UPI0033D706D3